jgi:thiosulfate dehydrogenase [quinone] large subunit
MTSGIANQAAPDPSRTMSAHSDSAKILGYTTLRLAIGMSMLIHGVVRLPKIGTFTAATVKMFSASPLPPFAVAAFARITPPVELAIGLLVSLGLATRLGLTLGGAWMVILIFGSTLIEKYDVVGIQLIYSLIFFQLLQHLEQNRLSLDAVMMKYRGQKNR